MNYKNGEARKTGEVYAPGRALVLMDKEDADLSDRVASRLRRHGLFVGQVYNCTAGKTYMKYNDDVDVLVLGRGYEHAGSHLQVPEKIRTYVQRGSKLVRYEEVQKQRSRTPCSCGIESVVAAPC